MPTSSVHRLVSTYSCPRKNWIVSLMLPAAIESSLGHMQFHFLEGEVECGPGPGVEGFYDGPFYSYYDYKDVDSSVDDAYDLVSETIEEEGPFDGILGFSQGAATAAGFLAHHARHHPLQPIFRCAVFFNALPPFKVTGEGNFIFQDLSRSKLRVPSLHIMGRNDCVHAHSVALAWMMDSAKPVVWEHDKGHEIPRDRESNLRICTMIEDLCRRAAW